VWCWDVRILSPDGFCLSIVVSYFVDSQLLCLFLLEVEGVVVARGIRRNEAVLVVVHAVDACSEACRMWNLRHGDRCASKV